MYLHDLFASLMRRWYLLLVAVLITLVAAFGVARMVGPTYKAQGAVVLLPPIDPASPDANRFLALGSLRQAGDVLVRTMLNSSTSQLIATAVPGSRYTVEPDYTTSAPVILVTATAATPEAATQTLGVVIKQVPVNLGGLQKDLAITRDNQIVSEVIDLDAKPAYVMKGQLRAVAGAGVLVFGLLTLLIGAFDAALLRRRSARSLIHAVRTPEDAEETAKGKKKPTDDPAPIRKGRLRPADREKSRRTQ